MDLKHPGNWRGIVTGWALEPPQRPQELSKPPGPPRTPPNTGGRA